MVSRANVDCGGREMLHDENKSRRPRQVGVSLHRHHLLYSMHHHALALHNSSRCNIVESATSTLYLAHIGVVITNWEATTFDIFPQCSLLFQLFQTDIQY